MIKSILAVFGLILFNQVLYGQDKKVYDDGYLVRVGDKAPDFTIREDGGKTYRLSDLKGKVVMLQFTASWCSVCRTEMPLRKRSGRQRRMQVL